MNLQQACDRLWRPLAESAFSANPEPLDVPRDGDHAPARALDPARELDRAGIEFSLLIRTQATTKLHTESDLRGAMPRSIHVSNDKPQDVSMLDLLLLNCIPPRTQLRSDLVRRPVNFSLQRLGRKRPDLKHGFVWVGASPLEG